MRRRDFLKRLGLGTAAAAVAPIAFIAGKAKAEEGTLWTTHEFKEGMVKVCDEVPLNQHVYESFIIKDDEKLDSMELLTKEHLEPTIKEMAEKIDRQILGKIRATTQYDEKAKGTRITLDLIPGEIHVDPDLMVMMLK